MQPDAVRMPKPMSEAEAELAKLEKAIGQGKQLQSKGVEGAIQVQGQCPLCHHSASDGQQQMKLPEEMTRQMESSIDFGVGANGKMEEGRKVSGQCDYRLLYLYYWRIGAKSGDYYSRILNLQKTDWMCMIVKYGLFFPGNTKSHGFARRQSTGGKMPAVGQEAGRH